MNNTLPAYGEDLLVFSSKLKTAGKYNENKLNIQITGINNDMTKYIKRIVCGYTSCYVVEADESCILIDTGISEYWEYFEEKLILRGYLPDKIKLIVLTHGHFDHSGNTNSLRKKYGIKVAMHPSDAHMVEKGPYLTQEPKPFEPDVLLYGGQSLSQFGMDASVIHLPGHTQGSIGIMTEQGDFFAGDIFVNISKPALPSYAENYEQLIKSVERLKQLSIKTIYPGHGRTFMAEEIIERF
ncbi:MAG: MBL fold metallo-hydrolase [Clostridia bacterium]|nr:MBL fold metallo-hydrolase [Clostridia bacterium]